MKIDYTNLISVANESEPLEMLDSKNLPRDSVKSLLGFEKPKAILYVLKETEDQTEFLCSKFKFINPYGAFETKVFCIDEHLTKTCQDSALIMALYHGIQTAIQNQVQFLQVRYSDFPTLEQFLDNGRPKNTVQSDLMNYLMWVGQFIRLEFLAEEEIASI
jgi:hypothetical protein